MNNYLLDTHTFIWAIIDDEKLSKNVLNILLKKENKLFVSVVSFWEIAIKTGKGKLNLKNFNILLIPNYCDRLGAIRIPLLTDEAINYSKLPLYKEHKDPFDRMLISQCLKNNFTFLSKDSQIDVYQKDGLKYIW